MSILGDREKQLECLITEKKVIGDREKLLERVCMGSVPNNPNECCQEFANIKAFRAEIRLEVVKEYEKRIQEVLANYAGMGDFNLVVCTIGTLKKRIRIQKIRGNKKCTFHAN